MGATRLAREKRGLPAVPLMQSDSPLGFASPSSPPAHPAAPGGEQWRSVSSLEVSLLTPLDFVSSLSSSSSQQRSTTLHPGGREGRISRRSLADSLGRDKISPCRMQKSSG